MFAQVSTEHRCMAHSPAGPRQYNMPKHISGCRSRSLPESPSCRDCRVPASRNSSSSPSQTSTSDRAKSDDSGNPLLPDGGLGSLSDFAVESPQESQKETTVGAQVEEGLTPLKYVIWIVGLLSAIGVFYGLVFAASGSLSNFLKDKATFTRKDFIPYSEKRRLQQEAAQKERDRLGITSDENLDGPSSMSRSPDNASESKSDFKSLLPGS